MDNWNSVEEVLDFAIGEEEAAVDFYTRLAGQADRPEMREAFQDFAEEEKGHKEKLLAVKEGENFEPSGKKVTDLKIADYLVDVTPGPHLRYEEALIVAMKKEKAAFRLYSDLAAAAGNERVRSLFLALAQEEAKHKLRFEIEYDDLMTEN